jgi:hypothetical protein
MKNINIEWIKRKSVTGGAAYEKYLEKILKKKFKLKLTETDTKKTKIHANKFIYELSRLKYRISYLIDIFRLNSDKDVIIRDFFSTISMLFHKKKGNNIVLIYHIDPTVLSHKWLYKLLEPLFFKGLRKADAIVVISEYWKSYFEEKGYKNVYIIYNCYNLIDFRISNNDVELFKKKYCLNNKPIIYIGNCQKRKGVADVYHTLKNLDVTFVTSGKREIDIPTLNLNISYKEYLTLLKASSIIITMSKFKEGWCRTAHEGMLLKRPIIGSGAGGMSELLSKGGQIICNDFKQLEYEVTSLLTGKRKYNSQIARGYLYAKKFNVSSFNKRWMSLIKKVAKMSVN